MGLVVTAIGIFGGTTSLLLAALSFTVFRASPGRFQVRALALLLAADAGITLWGTSVMYFTDSERIVYASQTTSNVMLAIEPLAYLLLLGSLPSPLSRPLAWPPMRLALLALMPVAALLVVANNDFFLKAVIPGTHSPLDVESGPGFLILLLGVLLTNLLGLVLSLHSWRLSKPGSLERRKLGMVCLAFGVRDGLLLGGIGTAMVLASQGNLEPYGFYLFSINPVVSLLLWALLLGYAVLRTHVFDIDLKLKLAINRGTMGAIFLAAFFVSAQLIQNYTSGAYGWVGGAVVSGLLLFALRPLEKAAHRVADAALPNVADTAEYAAFRKLEVYKAAVEELAVGGINEKERRMLDRLRDKLSIAPNDAAALEQDLTVALRSPVRRATRTA